MMIRGIFLSIDILKTDQGLLYFLKWDHVDFLHSLVAIIETYSMTYDINQGHFKVIWKTI